MNCKDSNQFTIKIYSEGYLYTTLTCAEGQSIQLPSNVLSTGVGWTTQTYSGYVNGTIYSPGKIITPKANMVFTEIYAGAQNAEYTNIIKNYTKNFSYGAIKSAYVTGKSFNGQAFFTQCNSISDAYVSYDNDGSGNALRRVYLGPDHSSRNASIPALTASSGSGFVGVRSSDAYEIILHATIWMGYTKGIH